MENIISEICIKEGINLSSIIKTTKGFTSEVYLINDKYICKIASIGNPKLNKEISIYKNIKMDFMPKYICSGVLNNITYLIIEKIEGDSLYSIWNTLSLDDRRKTVSSIAKIINQFNNKDFSFLDESFKFIDWNNYVLDNLVEIREKLNKLKISSEFINDFIDNKLSIIFKENNIVLCFNDIHFDNFIYFNGDVYIIDFDRVLVGSIDYELMILKTMCDNPVKFASEEDEKKIVNKDYCNVFNMFLEEYPELKDIKYLNERVFVYQFIYLIKQSINVKDVMLINKLIAEFIANFS